MNRTSQESFMARLGYGLLATIIAITGVIAAEACDFWYWGSHWVEATTFSEYLQKTWYLPAGVGVIAYLGGVLRGSEVVEWSKDFWRDAQW